MNLPAKIRLKLLRQDALAALKIGGHVRVRLADHPLGTEVRVFDGRVVVPSPWRWKLYRKGWRARLDQLEREYGGRDRCALTASSLVLDIGANAGEFAHVAARRGARVYSVEPDAAVYACLVENIRGLKTASAHNALFWKEAADVPFASLPAQADSSVFAAGADAPLRRATTVDAFCAEHGIDGVDLLKCDAEGAEPEVLDGARETLLRTRMAAIDTGAERRGARTHAGVRERLEKAGFSVSDEMVGKRLMTFGVRA